MGAPEEEIVYSGRPTAALRLGTLVICLLLTAGLAVVLFHYWNQFTNPSMRYGLMGAAALPLLYALIQWIRLKSTHYELTTQRLRVRQGIFSRRTEEMELYRVKDITLLEPFLLRMANAGTIHIVTADASAPVLELRGIKSAGSLREQLRKHVEESRERKNTRLTELE